MSLKSVLTGVADKIRAIRGTSGTLSLDAMSANLSTVQSELANAFTAIGSKGGTVPSSKVSGNLASAINTIPTGVTVQRKSASFTTDNSGKATINCGFQPDVVYIQGETDTEDGVTYCYSMCMVFSEDARSGQKDTIMWATDGIVDMSWTRSSSGFSVSGGKYSWDMVASALSRKTFSYVAIKYT